MSLRQRLKPLFLALVFLSLFVVVYLANQVCMRGRACRILSQFPDQPHYGICMSTDISRLKTFRKMDLDLFFCSLKEGLKHSWQLSISSISPYRSKLCKCQTSKQFNKGNRPLYFVQRKYKAVFTFLLHYCPLLIFLSVDDNL